MIAVAVGVEAREPDCRVGRLISFGRFREPGAAADTAGTNFDSRAFVSGQSFFAERLLAADTRSRSH